MIITIVDIKHEQQRYPTVGDWQWTKQGNLSITISDMKDWRYNFLVAFHEQIEVMLCRQRGITQEEVDNWDLEFEARREDGNVDEPGDDPRAPYYMEHKLATKMEMELAKELGVDWEKYNETVINL